MLVDGVSIDIRDAPRELQEEAFRQGAIPFIPADGPPRPEVMPQEGGRDSATDPGHENPRGEPDPSGVPRDQLKIVLLDVEPPIGRRVLVPEDSTLAGLHRVVQAAMDWQARHLWRMRIGDVEYSDVPMEGWGTPVRAAGAVRLSDVAGPGSRASDEIGASTGSPRSSTGS